MSELPYAVAVVAYTMVGAMISAFAADQWRKRPWLHVLPFLYVCTSEALLAHVHARSWDWVAIFFFTALFWGVGWTTILQFKKPRPKRHGN